ncbi:MAG: hypothetical protein AAF570_14555 [Bacteroidota bacterium]
MRTSITRFHSQLLASSLGFFFLLAFAPNFLQAQSVEVQSLERMIHASPAKIKLDQRWENARARVATACNPDSVQYPRFKSIGFRGILVNNSSSRQVMQYYEAPQAITVHGFEFYAWSVSDPVASCTLSLYAAGPDSFPTGPQLAMTVVQIDSSFGNGALSNLRYFANFNTPVTVNQAYCLVFENQTATDLAIVSNDYQINDGQGEWLSGFDSARATGSKAVLVPSCPDEICRLRRISVSSTARVTSYTPLPSASGLVGSTSS